MDSNEFRGLLLTLDKTDITNATLGEIVRALLPKTHDYQDYCSYCNNPER